MRHTIILTIALLLIATGCRKKMSPQECQQEYNKIMADYHRNESDINSLLYNNIISTQEWEARHQQNASIANVKANALEDCQGWQTLY